MIYVAIILGGCIAAGVLWALDRRPVTVERKHYTRREWWRLWE